jgi:hypothetical protein
VNGKKIHGDSQRLPNDGLDFKIAAKFPKA